MIQKVLRRLLIFLVMFLPLQSAVARTSLDNPDLRDQSGLVLSELVTVDNSTDYTTAPAVATNLYNGEMLVVFEVNQDIYGQRLNADGSLIGARFWISTGGSSTSPDVAYEASIGRFIVVWENADLNTGDVDIRVSSVYGIHQPSGSQLAAGAINIGGDSYDETQPSVACNRDQASCLVVGTYEKPDYEIMGQRVAVQAGMLTLDGDRFSITVNALHEDSLPDVAFGKVAGSGVYLVTWDRTYDYTSGIVHYIMYAHVYGAEQGNGVNELVHVPLYLTPPSANPANDRNCQVPSVAFSAVSEQFLIAYMYQYSSTDSDVYGRHVHGFQGQVIGNSFIIAASIHYEGFPEVAFLGGETPWLSTNFADQYLVTFIYDDISGSSQSVRVQAVDGAASQTVGEQKTVLSIPTHSFWLFSTRVTGSYDQSKWFVLFDLQIGPDDDLFGCAISPFGSWTPMIQK